MQPSLPLVNVAQYFLRLQRSKEDPLKRICVIDDDPVYRRMVKLFCSTLYEVVCISHEELDLSVLRLAAVDLILLDLCLPGTSGEEICSQLKMDPLLKNIPIIFVSGRSKTQDNLAIGPNGAKGFISKPFRKDDFLEKIESYLNT